MKKNYKENDIFNKLVPMMIDGSLNDDNITKILNTNLNKKSRFELKSLLTGYFLSLY